MFQNLWRLSSCQNFYVEVTTHNIKWYVFRYSSVDIWEISLPPPLIEIKYETGNVHGQLIDEIRMMSQKGHEIFSLIQDKLTALPVDEQEVIANMKQLLTKEQAQFKQKVEEVQLKLTSPTIENKDFDETGENFCVLIFIFIDFCSGTITLKYFLF